MTEMAETHKFPYLLNKLRCFAQLDQTYNLVSPPVRARLFEYLGDTGPEKTHPMCSRKAYYWSFKVAGPLHRTDECFLPLVVRRGNCELLLVVGLWLR